MSLLEFEVLCPLFKGREIMLSFDKANWHGPFIYHKAFEIKKEWLIHSDIRDYGYPRFFFIKNIKLLKIISDVNKQESL
jgi:hypothetical protein